MSRLAAELHFAIRAVCRASEVTRKVAQLTLNRESTNESMHQQKSDHSPVTVADYCAQAVISHELLKHFPNDRLVAEEDTKELQEGSQILKNICELTRESLQDPQISDAEILSLINRSTNQAAKDKRFWTLDPVDGTKGFLRGGQYAVCLALIVDGQVQLGVLGCPNLEEGLLYFAVKGSGAFRRPLFTHTDNIDDCRLECSNVSDIKEAKMCESVESGHSDHSASSKLIKQLGCNSQSIRMDSQCKYAMLASGKAEIYLRMPVNKEYKEKIWDHAAGTLIVEEAGGHVTDLDGKQLDFATGGHLLSNNRGILAACSRSIHAQVLTCL